MIKIMKYYNKDDSMIYVLECLDLERFFLLNVETNEISSYGNTTDLLIDITNDFDCLVSIDKEYRQPFINEILEIAWNKEEKEKVFDFLVELLREY